MARKTAAAITKGNKATGTFIARSMHESDSRPNIKDCYSVRELRPELDNSQEEFGRNKRVAFT
jgi:hypothetical protein